MKGIAASFVPQYILKPTTFVLSCPRPIDLHSPTIPFNRSGIVKVMQLYIYNINIFLFVFFFFSAQIFDMLVRLLPWSRFWVTFSRRQFYSSKTVQGEKLYRQLGLHAGQGIA
jgi:hypothetical protein